MFDRAAILVLVAVSNDLTSATVISPLCLAPFLGCRVYGLCLRLSGLRADASGMFRASQQGALAVGST